jgi:hypothetical protein
MATKPQEQKKNQTDRNVQDRGQQEQQRGYQNPADQGPHREGPQREGDQSRGFEEEKKQRNDPACEPCDTTEQHGTRKEDTRKEEDMEAGKQKPNVDKDEQSMKKAQPVADDL